MAKTFIGNIKGPKGDKGDKGDPGTGSGSGTAATISVGSVTTGAAGSSASVTNSGTTSAAVFDFVIPKGDKGEKGDTGATGAQGIQGVKGDTGATGAAGAAATISIGTVTTGAAGTSASVTNVGTSTNAKLNFVIPKGDKGDTGDGASVNIIDNLTSTLVNAALSANQGKVLDEKVNNCAKIMTKFVSGSISGEYDYVNNDTTRFYCYIKGGLLVQPLLIAIGSFGHMVTEDTTEEQMKVYIDYPFAAPSYAHASIDTIINLPNKRVELYVIGTVYSFLDLRARPHYIGQDKIAANTAIGGKYLIIGPAHNDTVKAFGGIDA